MKRNHVGAQVSGSQLKVRQGDDVLWYLSPELPAAARAARCRAPASAKPNVPYQVTVYSYADDGTRSAGGRRHRDRRRAAPTDAAGHTMVTSPAAGTDALRATRATDIPSNRVRVCVEPPIAPSARDAHGRADPRQRPRRPDRGHAGLGRDPGRAAARRGRHPRRGRRPASAAAAGRDKVILERGDHDDRIAAELRAGGQEVTPRPRPGEGGGARPAPPRLAGCGFGPGPSSRGHRDA